MRHCIYGLGKGLRGFNPRICKRCDQKFRIRHICIFSFNPRICKRCDFIMFRSFENAPVSIHASVKDATYRIWLSASLVCFNPRICKRCDCCSKRGEPSCSCFNPRICKRCDRQQSRTPLLPFVSIHASVKDATPCL